MAATMRVEGAKELVDKLDELDNAVRNRIGRRAAKTAMIPVGKTAKSLIRANKSVESKALVKSIGNKQKVFRAQGSVVSLIGPRVSQKYVKTWKGRQRKPWKYAHFVELGTKSGGNRSTPSRPKPFLKPALKMKKTLVVRTLGKELGRRIELEAKKK